MTVIEAKDEVVTIQRVVNGWVLHSGPSGYMHRGEVGNTCVARTPRELADLIQAWSQQQAEMEKEKAEPTQPFCGGIGAMASREYLARQEQRNMIADEQISQWWKP